MSSRGIWQTTREELAKLCAAGLPEEVRPHVWRLLLAIVPPTPEGRDGVDVARLEQYQSFLDDAGVPRDDDDAALVVPTDSSSVAPNAAAEVASTGDAEPAQALRPYADQETLRQITSDLDRCAGGRLHFFIVPRHRAAMRRVLLLSARLNGGLGYVQGMCEILAPLYHVFTREEERARRSGGGTGDEPTPGPNTAEAWSFFALTSLMSDCRDLYMRDMDAGGGGGVRATLERLDAMLRRREPAVAAHLAALQLPSVLWAFRWLSTLLVYEFELPDLIALWDVILADPRRSQLHALLATAVAMLRLVRRELLGADFAVAMKLLQSYPPCDMLLLQRTVAAVRREEEEEERAAAGHGRGGVGGWQQPPPPAPPGLASPLPPRLGAQPPPKSPAVAATASGGDAPATSPFPSPHAAAASLLSALSGLRRRVPAFPTSLSWPRASGAAGGDGGGAASPFGDVELQEK